MATIDWTAEVLGQIDTHWQERLRPQLEGLTDEEYFWEPVPGCWSVRRRRERGQTRVGSDLVGTCLPRQEGQLRRDGGVRNRRRSPQITATDRPSSKTVWITFVSGSVWKSSLPKLAAR